MKQPPEVISQLYDQWAELSGHIVLSRDNWEYLNSNTGYNLDQSNVETVMVRIVEDNRALKGFRYPCSRCGGLMQADPSREWALVIQKGVLFDWALSTCMKNQIQAPKTPA